MSVPVTLPNLSINYSSRLPMAYFLLSTYPITISQGVLDLLTEAMSSFSHSYCNRVQFFSQQIKKQKAA